MCIHGALGSLDACALGSSHGTLVLVSETSAVFLVPIVGGDSDRGSKLGKLAGPVFEGGRGLEK